MVGPGSAGHSRHITQSAQTDWPHQQSAATAGAQQQRKMEEYD